MSDLDITTLILSEHEAFRRAFAALEGTSDATELAEGWQRLADQLEVHAAAEEEIYYPALLRKVDESEDDTEHAIKDHNKIRDAVDAVAQHEVATEAWWQAFRAARKETVEHLEEEEHDVLPPFKDEVDEQKRTDLGMRWLKFHEDHDRARGLSGEKLDPQEYVEENAS